MYLRFHSEHDGVGGEAAQHNVDTTIDGGDAGLGTHQREDVVALDEGSQIGRYASRALQPRTSGEPQPPAAGQSVGSLSYCALGQREP